MSQPDTLLVESAQPTQTRKPQKPASSRTIDLRYLRPDELAAWDRFVDLSPQASPFVRSWWLHAVGGEVHILGAFRDGQLLAGFPLYFESRFGMRLCTMPKLTQTLGPVLAEQNDHHTSAAFEETELLNVLAQELAKNRIFFQAFHPSLQTWSSFYWAGFSQTSRATHILQLDTPDKMLRKMTHGARQKVRQADRAGIVVAPCSPDQVWHAEQRTYAAQHMRVPHSVEYLRCLYAAAKANNAGECFAAFDPQQKVLASAFMIWDRNRAYAVTLGRDPESPIPAASSLLVWHMIQFAAQKSPILDFTGSMIPGVDRFWRTFGSVRVPYSWIMKFPLWLKIYLSALRKF